MMNKKRIIKNIAVICAGVFLLFTAYDGPTMLQSTMNKKQNIGVICQAIVYGSFCLSSLLFPKYVIQKLGSKLTFIISMLTYVPYVATNYYPHWLVMIPTSLLIGLGASLLWGSQASYLNDLSGMYAELCFSKKNDENFNSDKPIKDDNFDQKPLTKDVEGISCIQINTENLRFESIGEQTMKRESLSSNKSYDLCTSHNLPNILKLPVETVEKKYQEKSSTSFGMNFQTKNKIDINPDLDIIKKKQKTDSVTARVFGIHCMAYLSCHLWSNIMSYFILKSGVDPQINFRNRSVVCGANYCNLHSNIHSNFSDKLEEVSDETRYILTTVCLALGIAAVLIVVFFLDPVQPVPNGTASTFQLVMATAQIIKRTEILLLIPSSFYIGQTQGFYSGEFTKAYVSCSWGTYHVPLVTVSYGFFCALSATSSGWLVKYFGRRFVFTLAALLNVASVVLHLFWIPDPSHPEMYFITAGMWGAYVGAILSQIRALYGVLFKTDKDAAFAAFHLWYSLGFCLSFGYSGYFCTYVKLYMLLIVSSFGYIGYLIVESIHTLKNIKK